MSKNKWQPIDEPGCREEHPTLRYLCGWNEGHTGDHCEGICLNSWPNTAAGQD